MTLSNERRLQRRLLEVCIYCGEYVTIKSSGATANYVDHVHFYWYEPDFGNAIATGIICLRHLSQPTLIRDRLRTETQKLFPGAKVTTNFNPQALKLVDPEGFEALRDYVSNFGVFIDATTVPFVARNNT